jgi:hypothetical protein
MRVIITTYCFVLFVCLLLVTTSQGFHSVRLSKKTLNMAASEIIRRAASKYERVLGSRAFANIHDLPVGGNVYPLGVYYFEIIVGTPGRSFNVVVDTGSCTLLVPGVGCKGCPRQDPNHLYDPRASSTSAAFPCGNSECFSCQQEQCTFHNEYQTCNLSNPTQICVVEGPVFKDKFRIADNLQGNAVFGSITLQSRNFQQFAVIDGVLGLGCRRSFGQPTVLEYLVETQQIPNQFSFCFDATGQGGVFTFGGADPKLYFGSFQYTKLISSPDNWYLVRMIDLKVAGKSIGVPSSVYNIYGGTFVDSGTNIFLLPHQAFTALEGTMRSLCSTTKLKGVCENDPKHTIFNKVCFALTPQEIAMYPNLTIALDGVSLTMTPQQYLVVVDKPGHYCLGIMDTGYSGFTIIGDTVMFPYVLLFDRTTQRLGFAPVNSKACVPSNY